MTDQTWLQSLKVGDEVAWRRCRNREPDRYWTGRVSNITKTQIVAAHKPDRTGFSYVTRFRKSDCREIGAEPGTYYLWLIEPTSEVVATAAEQDEREELLEKLEYFEHQKYSIDQLRRIVAILDEGKGET